SGWSPWTTAWSSWVGPGWRCATRAGTPRSWRCRRSWRGATPWPPPSPSRERRSAAQVAVERRPEDDGRVPRAGRIRLGLRRLPGEVVARLAVQRVAGGRAGEGDDVVGEVGLRSGLDGLDRDGLLHRVRRLHRRPGRSAQPRDRVLERPAVE